MKTNTKRECNRCGRIMKQQFIGLKYCQCGMSWKKGIGYFKRSSEMVFKLEKVTKGKKGSKTKQVPTIIINKIK